MKKSIILMLSGLAIASTLLSTMLLYASRDAIFRGYGDFVAFYTGAQIVREGHGEKLYDLSLQEKYQDQFDVPIRTGPLPYIHPPFELLWHIPLSYLSYAHAFTLCLIANLIFLYILHRGLDLHKCSETAPMFLLLSMGFYPVVVTLIQGQDSILFSLILTGAFISLKQGKQRLAGTLVALAIIKPQAAIPAIAVLFFRPYATAIKSFLAMLSILLFVCVVMVGWEGAFDYIRLLQAVDIHNYALAPQNMPNIRGLVHLTFHTWNPQIIFPVIACISLALLGAVMALWRRCKNDAVFDLKLSLTLVITILLSYHCHVHDLALFLVPAALVLKRLLNAAGRLSANQWILLVWIIIPIIPFTLTFGPLYARERFAWGALYFVAAAVLIAIELKRSLDTKSILEVSKHVQ